MAKEKSRKPTGDEKLLAAVSYFWILSLLILVSKKDSEYVTFHAKQGMVLFFASLILWFIPEIGLGLEVANLLLMLLGFRKALDGKRYPIPFVAEMAGRIG